MEKLICKDHKYYLGGRRLTSPSAIFKGLGLTTYGLIPKAILDEACAIGEAVHKVTEGLDLGIDLDYDSRIEPYINGYKAFLSDHEVKWIIIEEPIASKKYGFATTPDRIGLVDGVLVDAEIKTTHKIEPTVYLQTAAHCIAYKETYKKVIPQRAVIWLSEAGYEWIEIPKAKNKQDEATFIGFLSLYNWKINNKIGV